ncbi:MAG: excinuclease ABC subunit UvrC [Methanotrichaceae archaeon]|nr:excinuclease ABC subunit UvrC [Methanotrichaceae archaeon]
MNDLEMLPHLPGCYLYKDASGNVLYVGKAKDLKKRISSYFQKCDNSPKTESLVRATKDIGFIVTNNEVEALILENTLIKKHWPRYNIALKDSKRYACIHLTEEKWPRIHLSRKKEGSGSFFGPFTSARERDYVLSIVRKTFQLRTCKRLPKRACLRFHMGVCSGPCMGRIAEAEYNEKVRRAESVLNGNISELIESMKEEMRNSAAKLQFERSIEIRNEIAALEWLQEGQIMERRKRINEDLLNYIVEEGVVYLMLFRVYKGVLEGKEDFIFEFKEDFLEEFIIQYYSETEPPDELIVPEPLDMVLVEYLIHVKGSKVKVTVPKRGEKRELLELARKNIEIVFFNDKKKLEALHEALPLPGLPNIIECFDVSHFSGTYTVGSMVQFREGKPDKSNYRRFRIRNVNGIDDFASIAEVVRRRYMRLKQEKGELPDLIIIDGGLGQLSAAANELRRLKLRFPLISIAKREEQIHMLGFDRPLPIKKGETASLFIQEIRDEAHRFAINYNRLLTRKALVS